MKQGTTTTFKVKQFDLPDITEIIFSFTNDKNNVVVERTTPTTDDGQIHKSYPSEVSLEDGYYKIGLDQDETLSLNETFYVEAQIMFSGAVTKAYIDKVKMPHTFYTKVIDGATTNGEEIELAMELSDVIEINGSTGDYTDLTNKPKINNIELIGNKTTSDLGLDIEVGDGLKRVGNVVSVDNGDYLYFKNGKLDVGTNVLGASNLRQWLADTSYATQYKPLATREYVDNLISTSLKRLVVEQLPQNPNTYTIYMVLRQAPTTNNIYDEYMYINNAWELIGSTEVDLSNYYTKAESNQTFEKQLATENGITITRTSASSTIGLTISSYLNGNKYLKFNTDPYGLYLDFTQMYADGLIVSKSTFDNGMLAKQDKLTAGTNITIDSNNVISASGGGLSYTFTDGLTESSGTVGIDLASGSKLLIDANDKLDVDLSSKQDTIDSSHKLSADNVDDTNTSNKFVSASEKQGWNAKADTSDIPTNVSELTNDSGYQTSSDVALAIIDKEDKTDITTDTTSTTVSLTLADNHEYRYTQDLTSLTLTMPSGDFISSIVFASGSTPTSMTYDSNIKWSGDDVTNGQFVPSADKDYDIMMYYNGLNVNGIVRGV